MIRCFVLIVFWVWEQDERGKEKGGGKRDARSQIEAEEEEEEEDEEGAKTGNHGKRKKIHLVLGSCVMVSEREASKDSCLS